MVVRKNVSNEINFIKFIFYKTPFVFLDIDTQIQAVNIDKTYVTALLARGGLLWVGTDTGIVITYPLPRLGGVPQVSGKPCVSFHGHEGPVRCFYAFRVKRRIKHGTENRQGKCL